MFASKPAARFQCDAPDCGPRGCITADQHNEPNPILVEFRRVADLPHLTRFPYSWQAGHWILNWTIHEKYLPLDLDATDEHLEHARRVLARLANLTKEN